MFFQQWLLVDHDEKADVAFRNCISGRSTRTIFVKEDNEHSESIKHARGRLAILEYEQKMPEEARQPLEMIEKSKNWTPGS